MVGWHIWQEYLFLLEEVWAYMILPEPAGIIAEPGNRHPVEPFAKTGYEMHSILVLLAQWNQLWGPGVVLIVHNASYFELTLLGMT
jgi:hypothetical protein